MTFVGGTWKEDGWDGRIEREMGMKKKERKPMWVVIHIFSGIVESVWLFCDYTKAFNFQNKKMGELGFIYNSEREDFVHNQYGYLFGDCQQKDEYVLKEIEEKED